MACLGFQTSHLKRRDASFGTRTETQLAEQVDQAEQQSEHHVTTGRRRHRLAKDRKVQKQRELGRDPENLEHQRLGQGGPQEVQKQRHCRCGSDACVGAMLVGARQRRRDPSVPLPLLVTSTPSLLLL